MAGKKKKQKKSKVRRDRSNVLGALSTSRAQRIGGPRAHSGPERSDKPDGKAD